MSSQTKPERASLRFGFVKPHTHTPPPKASLLNNNTHSLFLKKTEIKQQLHLTKQKNKTEHILNALTYWLVPRESEFGCHRHLEIAQGGGVDAVVIRDRHRAAIQASGGGRSPESHNIDIGKPQCSRRLIAVVRHFGRELAAAAARVLRVIFHQDVLAIFVALLIACILFSCVMLPSPVSTHTHTHMG